MVIYSFRGERLSEHSYLTLRLYVTAFGERHEEVLANRLGLRREVITLLLRTAYFMHDVGKALRGYQENVRRGFWLHEIVSGYLVYETLLRMLFEMDSRNPPGYLARASALAVLQHHQAMRGLEEILLGYDEIPLASGMAEDLVEEMKLAADLSGDLLPHACGILSQLDQLLKDSAKKLPSEVPSFVYDMIRWLKGQDVDKRDAWEILLRYQPMLSAPLQLCDSFAALMTRGGRLRGIHGQFLNLLRAQP